MEFARQFTPNRSRWARSQGKKGKLDRVDLLSGEAVRPLQTNKRVSNKMSEMSTRVAPSVLALALLFTATEAQAEGGAGGIGGVGGGGGTAGAAAGGYGGGFVLTDGDGDGVTMQEGDCDDSNQDVYPGATEICNGQDDNCDGAIDEGLTATHYFDGDDDGWGNAEDSTVLCIGTDESYVPEAGDCDDANPASYPGAEEICDGQDNDCNGQVDDGLDCADQYAGLTPTANGVTALLLAAWMGVSVWRRKRKLSR